MTVDLRSYRLPHLRRFRRWSVREEVVRIDVVSVVRAVSSNADLTPCRLHGGLGRSDRCRLFLVVVS